MYIKRFHSRIKFSSRAIRKKKLGWFSSCSSIFFCFWQGQFRHRKLYQWPFSMVLHRKRHQWPIFMIVLGWNEWRELFKRIATAVGQNKQKIELLACQMVLYQFHLEINLSYLLLFRVPSCVLNWNLVWVKKKWECLWRPPTGCLHR